MGRMLASAPLVAGRRGDQGCGRLVMFLLNSAKANVMATLPTCRPAATTSGAAALPNMRSTDFVPDMMLSRGDGIRFGGITTLQMVSAKMDTGEPRIVTWAGQPCKKNRVFVRAPRLIGTCRTENHGPEGLDLIGVTLPAK